MVRGHDLSLALPDCQFFLFPIAHLPGGNSAFLPDPFDLAVPVFFHTPHCAAKRGTWYFLGNGHLSPLCAVCVLYASFVLLCGINYHRYPFSQVCGLTVQDSTVEELQGLCTELAQQASSLREQVAEDENGVMVSSFPDAFQVARESQSCYDKLADRYPTLPAGYGQPKPVMASRLMSYGNITGIYIPFTCEANVNIDVPDYSIPATMCHELTHLRGYMREEEGQFYRLPSVPWQRQPGFSLFRRDAGPYPRAKRPL